MVISSRKQDNVTKVVDALRQRNLDVHGVTCHVGKDEDRKRLIEETLGKYGGKIDVLVSNAAANPGAWSSSSRVCACVHVCMCVRACVLVCVFVWYAHECVDFLRVHAVCRSQKLTFAGLGTRLVSMTSHAYVP